MAFVVADRVKETTATTGTGTLTLAGAVTQFQSFGAVGNTNQCNYCLLGGNGTDWEVGIGTYTLSGTTLSRDTVLASSNSGSKISLTGTSTVFLTEPAIALQGRICAPYVAPTAAANWTARNSASIANVANGVQISDTAQTSSTIRMATLASPVSTPYTIDANVQVISAVTAASPDSIVAGIGWTDGTKVQFVGAQQFAQGSTSTTPYLSATHFSNFTTFVANDVLLFAPINFSDLWFRIADNGTNVTFSFGNDGVTFTQVFTVAKSSGYLGSSGYSNVGFLINNSTGASGLTGYVTLKSWWQH